MKSVVPYLFVAVALAAPASAGPKKVTVYGSNNIAVDTAALQSAIDNAPKNGTVELVGTFQLDGTLVEINRDHITIEGHAIDADNDGAVNEDWADGVDNDGDGLIDEDDWDAQINGLLDGDGLPVDDVVAPDFAFVNRGLTVWGITEDFNQITIRNISFFGLNRAIQFGPDTRFADGLLCDDVVVTGGSVSNAVVEGNRFDNVDRGFQIFGDSTNVSVRNNLFTNWVRATALPLVSTGAFCFDSNGDDSAFPVGNPLGTSITGNVFIGGTTGAIFVGATATDLRGNTISYAPNGIFIQGTNNQAQHNAIDNVNNGIFLAGVSDGTLVANNTVAGAGFSGIFFMEASGGTALNNHFSDIGYVDYFLDEFSFENKVRLRRGQTFDDQGIDNDVR
jgi:parallel beta-helix repeat protein